MPKSKSLVPTEPIERRILLIRDHKAIIDADLAELYGVQTKSLNQAVKRNKERFPSDFMFQLTKKEKDEVVTNCDHLQKLKFSRTLPYAFTEHGAIMAASVLNTQRAHKMMIFIVRAFVNVRVVIEDLPAIKYLVAKHDVDIQDLQIAVDYLLEEPKKGKIGFKTSKKA